MREKASKYPTMVMKLLLAFNLLCIFIFTSEAVQDYVYHNCPNTTTYTPNSTYQLNLNRLLSSLSSNNNTRNNLFYNATVGNTGPDRAYGLFVCRGDVTNDTCHDCVVTATTEIIKRCPRQKVAIIWYEKCMLRYENRFFFSTLDTSGGVYLINTGNTTDTERFTQVLGNSMNNLATRASDDRSTNSGVILRGFATGESNLSSSQTLYSLVQCTPDLSSADCNQCLRVAIDQLPSCCTGRPGGRVLLPSCNVRYETYLFYRAIASLAPPPAPTISPPPAPRSSTSPGGERKISTQVIIAIVVPVVVSVLLFAMAFCFLIMRAKKKHAVIQGTTGVDESEISAAESLQYDINKIVAATNNFSVENKVGEGGFGEVFKGVLPNGQEIAVKRLSRSSGQGAHEFRNEVLVVAKLQHRNLARLVGYCLERDEKILIYEFFPNKSLDYFLYDPEKKQLLDWSTRYKIIRGITLGILYLHEDSRLRIIHRDLKASNVLLDGDMNPKISDFGMARIFGVDQSQGNTSRVVGTFGYMSPEYAMHGQFSVKSDVFSFGVLILEIVCGKKNSREDLLGDAWKCWRDGAPLDIVDPSLGDSFVRSEVMRCIHIGLLCVQEDVDERPTMASVVLMLSSETVTLPVPGQPPFFFQSRTETSAKKLVTDESSSKSLPWSANEVSITELHPR